MTRRQSISVVNSAASRFKLLETVLSGGSPQFHEAVVAACKSQVAFASLNLPEIGVVKLSLNTLKKVANITIEKGGWDRVDKMRRELYMAHGRSPKPKKRAETGPSDPLELERRLRLRLGAAYTELLQKLIKLSDAVPELEDFVKRHQAGFSLATLQLISGGGGDR
ncbi:MAG: hypothetical protein EON58_01795 [Alphaproteobacteria bacterium]|nr:MAG: hypothetical protein EON58_01795 [Alphaproteobacteria bacterium]